MVMTTIWRISYHVSLRNIILQAFFREVAARAMLSSSPPGACRTPKLKAISFESCGHSSQVNSAHDNKRARHRIYIERQVNTDLSHDWKDLNYSCPSRLTASSSPTLFTLSRSYPSPTKVARSYERATPKNIGPPCVVYLRLPLPRTTPNEALSSELRRR